MMKTTRKKPMNCTYFNYTTSFTSNILTDLNVP